MKPTIYLGLLANDIAKLPVPPRLYEEEYGKGNIPSEIAFLAVDSDTGVLYNDPLANLSDDFIKIESSSNPREFYRDR